MPMNPRLKRWLKILGLAAAGCATLLLLLVAAVVLTLNTQWGRDKITTLVNEKASSPAMTITLDGLQAAMPWDLRLQAFSLADKQGVWLSGKGLSFSLDVAALLDKAVTIEHIILEQVEYLRPPVSEEKQEEPEPARPISLEIPQIPPVRIDTLRVDELLLHMPPPDAEQAAQLKAFSINGAIRPEGQDFIVELDVRELSQEVLEGENTPAGFRPDSLSLNARLQQPGNILAIDASLEEGSGGLAGKALGVAANTPVSGGLKGKGGLEDWQGRLQFDVGDTHLLTGDLRLRMDQEQGLFHASLTGDLQDPANLLPQDIALLSGSRADYDLAVTLPLDGDLNTLARLDKLHLASPTFSLDLGAGLRDGEITATVNLQVLEQSILPGLTQNTLTGAPAITASLKGNEQRMNLELNAGLGALALPQLSSKPLELNTKVSVESPLDAEKRSIAANGDLKIDGLHPPEDYTLDEKLDLSFDLLLPRQDFIRIRSLKLHNGENTLQAAGEVDLQAMQVTADLSADLPHAGALLTLQPLDAAITIQAKAQGAMESGIDAEINASLDQIKGLDPQLAALLGEAVQLKAEAFVDEKKLQLHSLNLQALTSMQASGEYEMQDQKLDAELQLTPPATLALPGEAGGPDALRLEGLQPLKLHASGSLKQRLEVTASGGASKASLPGRSFTALSLDLQAGVPLTPAPEEDHFSLDLKTAQIALAVSSRYQLEPDVLQLRQLQVSGPQTALAGSLRVGLKDSLLQGNIDLKAGNLAAYANLLGMHLAGAVNASLELSTPDNKQAAKLAASASNLAAAGAEVASLKLNASTTNAFALAQGQGNATLLLETGKAGVEAAYAESLRLAANLSKGVVNIDLDTKGQADKPFALALKAAVTPNPQRIEARLASMTGAYAAIPFKLRAPATIVSTNGGVSVQKLALGLDSATLHANGDYGPENVDLKLSLDSLQLQTLASFAPDLPKGSVDLQADLSGPLAGPRIQLQVNAEDVEIPQGDLEEANFPALALALKAEINGGKADAEANISHPGGKLAQVSAGVPLKLALQPFAFELKENAPVQAKVAGGFDLKLLQNALGLTDQLLDGKIDYDVAASGALNDPKVQGEVKLSKGRYENLKLGTLLTDLQITVTAKDDRFELTRLSANDGQGGTLNGSGEVTLSGKTPFKATVSMDKLSPAHMDMFQGKLSGKVDASGNLKEGGEILGRFKVLMAELSIPKNLPPDVASVDVIQKNAPGDPSVQEQEEEEEEQEKTEAFPLKLDIEVDFPGRFFVSGMGLDSEWGGNLQVKGTAAKPDIVGALKVQRGNFEFLDKNFTIKEGEIRFSGGTPPSPVLNVVTSSQAPNLEALVIISGTPQNLKITFDSNPPRPQNEILSAVLFGRSTDSLTPLQAIRLARALDQLAGGSTGNSLDILSNIKGVLGVDQLSAGEGESGDMALQAGKYLTDGVYLKGTKGLSPRDDSLSVEVEITPNLGLESQMGADSQGGVGLNWRYDY